MNNDIKQQRQVGHDCATFLPYPDDTSDFNLMITIKYYEIDMLEDSILAVAELVGLYNTNIDKSSLFPHPYKNQLILPRNKESYEKYFENNHQNKEVVDKILKELASVFNENLESIQKDIMIAVNDIINNQ